MQAKRIKVIAGMLLKCGTGKITIDPEQMAKANEAMTKDDIRNLIKEGIVSERQWKGQSRGRAREMLKRKKKGRRKGYGSRKGTKKARSQRKKEWMSNTRSQREKLKELKKEAQEKGIYSSVYRRINGNFFRGRKHLEKFVKGEK